MDAAFSGNASDGDGAGDDVHSWSFDGFRQLHWHSRSEPWGLKCKVGDVVSSVADLDRCELWFAINGNWEGQMGCMVRGLERDRDYVRGLTPAVSLNRTERSRSGCSSTLAGRAAKPSSALRAAAAARCALPACRRRLSLRSQPARAPPS